MLDIKSIIFWVVTFQVLRLIPHKITITSSEGNRSAFGFNNLLLLLQLKKTIRMINCRIAFKFREILHYAGYVV